MSNTVEYTKEGVRVDASKDGIIVRKHIAGLAGGRALDLDAISGTIEAYPGKHSNTGQAEVLRLWWSRVVSRLLQKLPAA